MSLHFLPPEKIERYLEVDLENVEVATGQFKRPDFVRRWLKFLSLNANYYTMAKYFRGCKYIVRKTKNSLSFRIFSFFYPCMYTKTQINKKTRKKMIKNA
jgi:hypothetical protein